MTPVVLRGLLGRRLRTALTALAIVLGVAMISGTFVLTDTIHAGFSSIFTNSYRGADAVVSARTAFRVESHGPRRSAGFPASVLSRLARLPEVGAAAGSVQDQARLVDRRGRVVQRRGPGLGFGIDARLTRLDPLSLVSGRWPAGPGEVAIDRQTARRQGLHAGDVVGVVGRGAERRPRITGLVSFPGGASLGGATISVFDVPTAQALFGKRGKLDQIRLAARPGVSPARLIAAVRPALPPTAQVRTAAAQASEDARNVSSFLSVLQDILLAFGGVALFVGSFVIANSLSITVAQRARELATLRTLGASARQVLASIVLEALVVGSVSSAIGLFAGLAVAGGLDSLFGTVGIDLPTGGTVLATRTVIVCLALGTGITVLAALRPAVRATRVPPIAAVREGAVLPPSALERLGAARAALVMALGLGLVAGGVLTGGLSAALRIASIATGSLALFLGAAMLAPRLVGPLAGVLGWPGARLAGAPGELARHNARRDPARTASTAAALMIGLALIACVAVLSAGLLRSFQDSVDRLFIADYAITSQSGFQSISPASAARAARAPGVEVVSAIREGSARVLGRVIDLTAVDRGLPRVLRLDWYRGSDAVPGRLGAGGAFLERAYARRRRLHVGSPLRLQTPSGRLLRLVVAGIFTEPPGGSPLGPVTISTALFDRSYAQPENRMAFVDVRGGPSKAATAALRRALRSFPDARIATRDQFKRDSAARLQSLLNLLYVLLALSVIVSLFGVVNTLVLTVIERTRELGMLRAVGMTRRQVRRMVRHESVVTALIGACLGIVLGLLLAGLITTSLEQEGFRFTIPPVTLTACLLAAIAVGILAAVLPARRAAGLDVLQALHYE